MTARIHLSPPDVGPLEESFVIAAVRSGWIAPLGPEVDAFEQETAARVDRAYGLATNSGTAALHLSLLALGIGPGDRVVVPTLTFAATANAVVYTGAEPVFVDCEAGTGNLDVPLVADLLRRHDIEGRQVAAVVPVDMFGSCVDYDALLPICEQAGVPVVEDAAEALGATRGARPAGTFGQASAFSFNGNKILTTSGGGMLLSDDGDLIAHARYLATQARQPVAHYEHTDIGYNYRLSNLLAAVGRAQLRRLDSMIERRRAHRSRYAELFANVPGVRLLAAEDGGANCWLTTVVVDAGQAGWHAADLGAHLAAADIETRPVWKPMHLQPVFAGARAVLTGAAQTLFENGLTLPSGSAMTADQVDRVCGRIRDFLRHRPSTRLEVPEPGRRHDPEPASAAVPAL
ncbi:DegT/DnrJ/EryC1/StrS family aminotransferase [Micromonospora endolithica]|uniref:DegT/DnrJ/EryC1/StrS family aminotransferase n=1 Tax=Micromonospora endolithica TaxID=230091 RepID=UPI0011AD1FAF|nr:aminotransferase class I/II-fold pyridoxal phosphate-dependent enzyme [Micromonospora endolithica]TWJ22791.1 dTDP-4-amino-4,6-dideoxygalactose transaminase [Micromonospora endolithica]